MGPLERFLLGKIKGSTDHWPNPTPEPRIEHTHPRLMPDDAKGPYG
jgi:hypothetical protein